MKMIHMQIIKYQMTSCGKKSLSHVYSLWFLFC